jgi:hypothetical protein
MIPDTSLVLPQSTCLSPNEPNKRLDEHAMLLILNMTVWNMNGTIEMTDSFW